MAAELLPPASLPVPAAPTLSPAAVYLARLAPRSRRTQAGALRSIVELVAPDADISTFPWHQLTYAHTQAVRSILADRYAPATGNRMLAALRGVLEEAWRLGLVDAETSQRARDLAPIRGSRPLRGRALSHDELSGLLRVCDNGDTAAAKQTHADRRDAALLAVLYGCGIRRAEAVALDWVDYNPGGPTLTIRAGKGNKSRICYLPAFARDRLEQWRIGDAGPIFTRIRRGDHPSEERLTDGAVRHILLTRCQQAGIADAAPHDMRRSYVSDLLDAGVDISTVALMAGHSSTSTTGRYDRRPQERMREAAERLEL